MNRLISIASPRIISVTPSHLLDANIAVAAGKAGGMAILDLGYNHRPGHLAPMLDRLACCSGSEAKWGIRWDAVGLASRGLDRLSELLHRQVPIIVLAGLNGMDLPALRDKTGCRQILVEAYDLPSAQAAIAAGCDGLIIRGHEAAGSVSRYSTFMLLQELSRQHPTVPYWVQGGIGMRSAAAAILAGAAGVVLCEQLWLAEESPLAHPDARGVWSQLDGSETVLLGPDETPFRLFARSGRAKFRELEQRVIRGESRQELLLEYLGATDDPLVPMGQDIAFAAPLAKRYGSVGCILSALRAGMDTAIEIARSQKALAPKSPLARMHGTRYPIVQGPMTRVSDTARFAKAVADGGGLPFFALSVMRKPQVQALLSETQKLLGNLPWGIGLLGFMPLKLRQEQLEVVREVKPPFAIIAGGRPSQARELEALAVTTYLHVPSPGLLHQFIKDGARKFIFEGSECGGHTGPRTSFVLWESAIEILTTAELPDPESVQVLFAGGIHDELSAAMLSVIAAPLVARGMRIGVLMGTAYLFTPEAVTSGAIVDEFQAQALACTTTALLQSGVGIYTRCAKTNFCDEFNRARRELLLANEPEECTLEALELLNIGRLRIASKGIAHNTQNDGDRYINVDVATQRREGLYMLGDVARLRKKTLTIAELHAAVGTGSQELLARAGKRSKFKRHLRQPIQEDKDKDIAVIGMACLLPKAKDLQSFWQNIIRGEHAFQEVSEERWRPEDFFDAKRGARDKVYTTSGAFLDDIQFDPTVYGIPPASMRSIEPLHLLALEVASQAFKDAGFDRRPFPRERTACIFAAGGMNDLGMFYIFRTLLAHFLPKVPGLSKPIREQILKALYEHELPAWTEDSFPGILANVVAGRVANRLDLGGTNFTVDAACAASLAALDVGIKQLHSGDADLALVGGVDATNSSFGFMLFSQTHALSPRGRCRPFDDSADGTALGEGVAAVVLKRLNDAERDGDRIYAVIKGIGSSSDGRNRSLTAPHPQGQLRALRRAYEDAGVAPLTVGLIEAHGTGTAVGDKSEIESLVSAFVEGDSVAQTCAVGSVKSMIGHTKLTAGLAGLIKAALALNHRVLPPTIGVEVPNSRVNFARTPFYINTETRPWLSSPQGHPRRSSVSAFGFGGTNFHTVLEEYVDEYRDAPAIDLNPRDVEPFVFFGAERPQIVQALGRLLQGIDPPEHLDLTQLAYSHHLEQQRANSDNGLSHCRLAVIATSIADLKQKLELALREIRREDRSEVRHPQGIFYRESDAASPVCFLFPGQGSQRVNMLRDLVATLPTLHGLFEQADALLDGRLPQALSSFIYPSPVFSDDERSRQQAALNATEIAQPALGVIDLAALEVLRSFGIEPDFVAGHSYGEYVALCAAGAIRPDELIRLSEIRGRIAANAGKNCPGALAAVDADGARLEALIARHRLSVSIANLNAPDQTIIGGVTEAIEEAAAVLRKESLRVTRVAVNAAFHTPAMAAARDLLATELARIELHKPNIPVFSNTTSSSYPGTADETRALLARQIVEPVRFAEEVEHLYNAGARVFVEVGPGLTLCGLVDRILGHRPHVAMGIDAPGRSGWLQLAHLVAHLFALGVPVQLQTWFKRRQLRPLSVAEVLEEARSKSNPGPLIWRVNGGRSEPWHTPPVEAKKAAPMLSEPGVAAASGLQSETETAAAAAALMSNPPPTSTPIQPFATNPMRDAMANNNQSINYGTAPPETGSAPHSYFVIAQNGVSQLIELQREQQRTLCSYIEFLQASLLGTSSTAEGSSVVSAVRAPAPAPHAVISAATPQRAVLASVPPAPVLPTQVSIAASAAEPPASSGEARSPQVTVPAPIVNTSSVAVSEAGRSSSPALAPTAEFMAKLLGAVSQRTGYPEEMLNLDAHLEADLGIDSIKRIEIFSALKEFGALKDLMEGDDEETVLEQLSALKTLREISAWYERLGKTVQLDKGAQPPKKASTPLPLSLVEAAGSQTVQVLLEQPDPVRCYAVKPVAADNDGKEREALVYDSARPILLLGPASEVSEAFAHALAADGYVPWQVIPGVVTRAIEEGFEVNFSSPDAADELRALLRERRQPVGALVNLLGLITPEAEHDAVNPARSLFLALKSVGPILEEQADGGWLFNLTALDGQFGLTGSAVFPVHAAGTLGVAKSAAGEWRHLRVKCIDLAPGLELFGWIRRVIKELHNPDPALEVGFTSQGRWHLELQHVETARDASAELALDEGGVLLITGGASGITAEVAKALARKRPLRMALVGRTALPESELASTRDIADPSELRDFLIREYRAKGGKVKPSGVEAKLKRILKEREIRRNLIALEETGAEISYHAVDVRDADAFGQLIDDVYERWGRIDGVIHGAGIVNDKLIRDKSVASFETVYLTKVMSALTLAHKLRPESLKFLVFFSSVVGRFGNAGQCDYSAGNEVLNKLADRLSVEWPNVHTVSINWGPWEGGMVSGDLVRLFASRGIRPIPMAIGAQYCLDVLTRRVKEEPELVITTSLAQIAELGHSEIQDATRQPPTEENAATEQTVA